VVFAAGMMWFAAAQPKPADKERETNQKALNDGNYKDAYEGFRKLALSPDADPNKVSGDFSNAIACLRNLGRVEEVDDFREKVIEIHGKNWRLLHTAANSYVHEEHYGYIVAGKFYRGHKRGGGRYVSTYPRDRARAMQLMEQAMPLVAKEKDKNAIGDFYWSYSHMLFQGQHGYQYESWRLQYLTDLSQLPDYEDGYKYYWGYGNGKGAPVDRDGKPVYHKVPKSYKDARSDGERWRWLMAEAVEFNPNRRDEADTTFADFLRSQFEVNTMAHYGRFLPTEDDTKKNDSGTYAMHTLKEDETIARLANGIKRFNVPDEYNWIKIYQAVAARGKNHWGSHARDTLAQIYEDRRQYVKAAEAWKKAMQEYGDGNHRQRRIDQIVGNWGRFENVQTAGSGTRATVDFRFRNADKVSFEAHAIKVEKLLDDVKGFLRSNPKQIQWENTDIANLGYRLVEKNQKEYLGDKVASWDQELKPRKNHVDDRITITTPLQKPGAYLLTGKMENGNISRVIVWINDTVIARKPLEGKMMYYVADAVTGKPVEDANVEFFGFKTTYLNQGQQFRIDTMTANKTTDKDGMVFTEAKDQPQDHTWLITATAKKGARESRHAYLGFTGAWYGQQHDPEYHATKVFSITDRPVYRPDQKVQFKFWIAHAKYDVNDNKAYADRSFTVQIHNPKGEKIHEKAYTSDEYAGLSGEFTLPKDATLGTYGVHVVGLGGTSFRVEEYKKPEFEVKVEAPKEPVKLGDKITATIEAKYYFGAPVAKGKVKYKVTRSSHDSVWYPHGDWDWYYGPGYWWFCGDYAWYPGFWEWGCKGPTPWWYWQWQGRWGNREQPEIVLENEVEIAPDGTLKVDIDTLPAREMHGDEDHSYTISVEVTDESRRTIVGSGNVLVSRKPFKVFGWVDRGHYRTGDAINSYFRAQTLDNKPVKGKGELTLYSISYDDKNKPVEKAVETWKMDTNEEGQAQQQMKAAAAGQYRLSYKLTDSKNNTIEGGYLFVVHGKGFDTKQYRFNDLELVTDKREYAPGDKIKLMINTNQEEGTVLLFVRPAGVYLAPKVIRLQGKSTVEEIDVVQKDMPNFYIEAVTVHAGRLFTEVKEIVVPPEKRILNVEVLPSQKEYKPGEKATIQVKLTDRDGKPFIGSTTMSVYDRSVEYIAGGTNVPEIKEYFWKWRRHHHPQTEASLNRWFGNLVRSNEIHMGNLGVFGESVVEEMKGLEKLKDRGDKDKKDTNESAPPMAPGPTGPGGGGGFGGAPQGDAKPGDGEGKPTSGASGQQGQQGGPKPDVPAPTTIRKNFADTAYWNANLTTNKEGIAEVSFTMPENLTGWKIRTWAMGQGTKVGQGETEVFTKKNILVRLQAPRFFVQKDEVVLSANVHNYLKKDKDITVVLELGGNTLAPVEGDYPKEGLTKKIRINAGGEQRVDWRVKVVEEGTAVITMKALSDEESDAMQMQFPCFVHGMLKTESFSGVVRPDKDSSSVTFNVPKERRPNESRLEVRYSPTLAGAMVDALPYMNDYPYGCTEQTLNRFLPTVITLRILQRMNLDLKDIQKKRTNLNAQEIGEDTERAKQWKRLPHNAVFDEAEVKAMAKAGIERLKNMQCSDGGWGWFSGWGEQSYPHTTAVVVHGLQIAKLNDLELPEGMLERGIAWLQTYQAQQTRELQNAATQTKPWREHANELDAFVFMVLVDAGHDSEVMRDFIYRDRTRIAVYAKAMYGLALHKTNQRDKLAMILKNIEQYVVEDDENQTAYLKMPENNYWWYWYGSENEANAYYLKLLSRTSPKDQKASRLVKYLLNNRKNATYWTNTRDTAICIEAMADYLIASNEDRPDMTIEVWLDGKKHKEVKVTSENLFSFDNKLVLMGTQIDSGKHTLEIKKKGKGSVYFNAYSTNFTLEDHITRAGLEVKVNRKYYKLERVEKKEKVEGAQGQVVEQKVEKYERKELKDGDTLKSGDLVEIELEIDSKNDYEYILFEDPKAAGFEPVALRSGYGANEMGAYMELRDAKVSFFVRALARGKHSLSYRMRAEIPGKFSALPTRAEAMYAPELKGNSDEIKLKITD